LTLSSPGGAAPIHGCRVVTTSMTARLLLANQLRSLSEISWSVVTGDEFDDAPAGLDVEVVPVRREIAVSDASAFLKLLLLFRRRRFDFIQTHTPKASLLGLPAARLTGTKAVYTIHGSLYFSDNDRKANLAGWVFEKWCCSWANLVLVQSREDEKVLPHVGICSRRKLEYVGNGVILDRFLEAVEPALIPGDPALPVVVMVSRLVKEKGCSDFLQMAHELCGKARFVHVGPVEADQSDAISADEIERASADVTFIGAVHDPRPYFAAADLVVLPSYREGIPRVAMEAAATGRPVVAYDVRGVREVIDPETGLLAHRGDVRALTQIVTDLLEDPERRVKLGDMCRERVVDLFSEDKVIDRLRSIYAGFARGAGS
jgi:glycosyltransferase involved in cell wall biosynthesis